jgi:REP element-mobilizing transposase RayT
MPYWRLYYHIVWATDERHPLITPEIETRLFRIIGDKCKDQGGQMYVVNGMPDHVHVVVAAPPAMALSNFVKGLKGSSSRFVHTEFRLSFAWQVGYGIFSISQRNLGSAIRYVRDQKEHHRTGNLIAALERLTSEDDGPRIMGIVLAHIEESVYFQ